MPRHARIVVAGVPHHVTQRGIDRTMVFFGRSDGLEYLRLLGDYSSRFEIEVVAYCLMPNHVHLVVVPSTADGLHRAMRSIHGRHARRVNRNKDRVGHLWQNRYFSSPLDSKYFLNAVRYVERNPVKARLVERAEDYDWSSAAAHCGCRKDPLVGARPRSTIFGGIGDWSEWLSVGLSDECETTLRRLGRQNLPCGSPAFIADLERSAGRPLQLQRRGRPPKCRDARELETPFLKKVNVPE